MSSVIVLSELKNEINELHKEVAALKAGLSFSFNELIELSSKMEALELTAFEPTDEEGIKAVNQIQSGIKSAIALEIGYDKI